MNIASLERQVIHLILPGTGQPARWPQAMHLINDALAEAKGERRGSILALRAVVLWRQSAQNVRKAMSLIEEALPLLEGDPLARMKAVLDGCLMAEFALDTERHRAWAKHILQSMTSPAPVLKPWLGRIAIVAGFYWETTGGSAPRAAAAFSQSASFYDANVGPFDERDRRCQQRHACAALGDILLRLGRGEEARDAYGRALRLERVESEGDAGNSAVFYLAGRLADLDGRDNEAVAAYLEGIRLAGRHHQDHRGLLRLVEALSDVYRRQGDLKSVSEIVLPLFTDLMESDIPQVALRLQQLATP